jgi:hypothetical protein
MRHEVVRSFFSGSPRSTEWIGGLIRADDGRRPPVTQSKRRPGSDIGSDGRSDDPVLQTKHGPVQFPKILQNFSDFPSHRIFRHMYEALNIDKK